MKPPLPPVAPPRAVSVPRISVRSVLLTMISPPWPLAVASARIVAPRSTVVRAAMVWLRPRPVLPTSTRPPPVPPEASMRAVAPTVTWPVACNATRPPAWPAPPVASSVPSRRTPPPSARSAISPVWPPRVGVSMRPVLRTRSSTRPEAAWADSRTEPPAASMTPLLVTSAALPSGAVVTARVTSMPISPSPARSSTKVSAAPRATRPRLARITPEFDTPGPTSAARPRSATVMRPRFSTRAPGRGAPSNTIRPAMKFRLVMFAAEAISEPTSTCAPPAKTMPDWLTMATPPLAWMRPAMTEGSGPTTRFSVQEPWLGWTNWTVCWLPTSNCCQSIAARLVDCVMVVRLAVCAMAAWPATTWPPVGDCASAVPVTGSSAVVASSHQRCGARRTGATGATGALWWRAGRAVRGRVLRAMVQNLISVRKYSCVARSGSENCPSGCVVMRRASSTSTCTVSATTVRTPPPQEDNRRSASVSRFW